MSPYSPFIICLFAPILSVLHKRPASSFFTGVLFVDLSASPRYKYLVICSFIKFFIAALLFSAAGSWAFSAENVVVIVNQKNAESSISEKKLQDYFMKKDRIWPSGDAVRFFDHRDDNKNRQAFLDKYIQKTSREVELYWIGEKIYSGHIAPIQITSDSMMAKMVSRFPGGIGFVSKKFKLPKTVKAISVKEGI